MYDNLLRLVMATSKTSSFWLTERINLAVVGILSSGTIDLGAYVDVGDQQALAIEQVDFITQGRDANGNAQLLIDSINGPTTVGFQLSDLNPGGTLLYADDQNLVASGNLGVDVASDQQSSASDFYPDTFGKLDEARIVVNDQLYFTGIASGIYAAGTSLDVSVRVKARIVKLSTKDWMAIAIQSTAADN
ncbi:MAG: hypothetical protein GY751_23800 [Bacteroidetes bacterium]|nr:hypothetical protein [Bacteroidota bacterium]